MISQVQISTGFLSGLAWSLYKCLALWRAVYDRATVRPLGTICVKYLFIDSLKSTQPNKMCLTVKQQSHALHWEGSSFFKRRNESSKCVTLFIVKINSITSCIRNSVNKSLFVDDFGVSYRSKHMQAIKRQLQLHLNRIEDWADNDGFKLSQSKTDCVHFFRRRGLHPDPNLVLS